MHGLELKMKRSEVILKEFQLKKGFHMCADFVTSEKSWLDLKVNWHENFPNDLWSADDGCIWFFL